MTRYMLKKRWELQKRLMFIQLLLLPVLGVVIGYLRDWNTLAPSRVCNLSIDVLGLIVLLILFMSAVKDRNDIAFRTGLFSYIISLNAWGLFLDIICWCVDERPAFRIVNVLANTCFYLCGIAVMMMFWHYLVELSESEDPRLKKLTLFLNIGGAASFAAIIGNVFGHYYFSVDANGNYSREKFYMSSQLFLLLLLICFILLITNMEITRQKKSALLSVVAAPFLSSIFQMLIYGTSITYTGLVVALIIIYGNVFTEQNRELVEQKLRVVEKERELLLAKREHERIEAELNLASEIQTNIVPRVFPPFPEHKEFNLYANMDPAKEVGGDFYDFFSIDSDHVALVIADVSGKGIPAALYMMTTKTMIKNAAMQGRSPKEVLEIVNGQLCEGTEEVQMFVTLWIAIIEISTGQVVAANAGHEYPAIRKKDGQFTFLKDKHGFVLGGLPGTRYKEYEFTMEYGDTIFVYTDGVTEATNAMNELFGEENLIKSLNKVPHAEPEELLKNVREDIDRFVGNEDQFDDITMLAISWQGGR